MRGFRAIEIASSARYLEKKPGANEGTLVVGQGA